MNLLLITQVMDRHDPLLGFMHEWVRRLAGEYENLTVICLKRGDFELPENVSVFSLGKEQMKNHPRLFKRLVYSLRFYRLIWRERLGYHTVFVHMNQEYVLLAGLFWKLWGKKIALWRNHPKGTFGTRIAVWLANKVFCTSEFAFTAQFKKTKVMPAGTDTDFFRRDEKLTRIKNSILCLGRISPIKKVEILLRALAELKEKGVDFSTDIVGGQTETQNKYYQDLRDFCRQQQLEDKVRWVGAVSFEQTYDFYNLHEIFVNLTPSGSLDKTVPEAMACECLVAVSNRSYQGKIDEQFFFEQNNPVDLAKKLQNLLALDPVQKIKLSRELRSFVEKNHSLDLLIQKLTQELNE